MAVDFYLQLDGIKGESADSTHLEWIECTSVHWSITQPKSATASTAGGHTAERAELSEISLSKLVDLASPILAQLCATGKTLPIAKLEMMRADGNGAPVKSYEVELENVLIAHIAPSFSGGGFPSESLGLKFSKVRWKYTRQKIGGGSSGNTAGGWNLATNRAT
ncbi:type VI secretion system tube protein Hcp [Massilia sp. H6]|uniref:Hcp family type VI secretion system effector n=1 Tax=Massilia sp. H6 TaxID=2970464 RepID=UPI00216775EE|nr:type VI secretion system tube protein Hcp [Massilia sp. H6]UVW27773.1 type VI secretion system tube protein Hcp [Massilia sp. H6]